MIMIMIMKCKSRIKSKLKKLNNSLFFSWQCCAVLHWSRDRTKQTKFCPDGEAVYMVMVYGNSLTHTFSVLRGACCVCCILYYVLVLNTLLHHSSIIQNEEVTTTSSPLLYYVTTNQSLEYRLSNWFGRSWMSLSKQLQNRWGHHWEYSRSNW